MSRKKKIVTVAMTFAMALGIGFVMQYDEAAASRRGDDDGKSATKLSRNASASSAFNLYSVETTPLPHMSAIQTVAAVNDTYNEVEPPEMGAIYGTPFGDCKITLSAEAKQAALVALSLAAPCHHEAYFVIRHEGMKFSGLTDKAGEAQVEVPALEVDASFVVSFDNVDGAFATVAVPDLMSYDRAVLQWRGKDNLQLHALEFGANIGDFGHVWSAAENDRSLTMAGERGFLTRLGTPGAEIPYLAEVYTFPTGMTNRDGKIDLQVGAVVTAGNCNHDIKARSIQTNTGRMLIARDLNIVMPGCDKIGESLMLNNVFRDVTLAIK